MQLADQYPGDPGVLVSLLMNRVILEPGQALYLPAGNLHAHLMGTGVEIMTNSDNVLQGGLTTKHVDIPELGRVVHFRPVTVDVLDGIPDASGVRLYPVPTAQFSLSRLDLSGSARWLLARRASGIARGAGQRGRPRRCRLFGRRPAGRVPVDSAWIPGIVGQWARSGFRATDGLRREPAQPTFDHQRRAS